MSLWIAVPFGVASATVYGTSIVAQHRAASRHADADGQASAAGLLRLARDPTFLVAIGGDGVGFALQIVALSLGVVVVIQPLVVLMLPVALAVSSLLGGHRPHRSELLGCAGVLAGLAVFLALIGQPVAEHVPASRSLTIAIVAVLLAGIVLVSVVTGRSALVRGAMYGAVAGMYFGLLAVMVDAASQRASEAGVKTLFTDGRGLVPLIGILVLGAGGIVLTQMSFQVGALGATLPASLAADPVTGVVFGALLLAERIPHTPVDVLVYAGCLAAVVAGAIRLANPPADARDADRHDASVDLGRTDEPNPLTD